MRDGVSKSLILILIHNPNPNPNLILGVEDLVEERIAFLASMEMENKIVLSRIVSMT